jgi:hypothetical protein
LQTLAPPEADRVPATTSATHRVLPNVVAGDSGDYQLASPLAQFWLTSASEIRAAGCGPPFERLGDFFETVQSWRDAVEGHLDNAHTRFSVSCRQARKLKEPRYRAMS